MIMEPSHYLPSEVLKHSNYPEIEQVKNELKQIENYASEVNTAIAQFNELRAERVYVNVGELTEHIDLCRIILEFLGTTKNPCFDLIMSVRSIQEMFHEVRYADRQYRGQYVSATLVPSEVEEEGGGI